MRELSILQMEEIEGGGFFSCVGAVISTGLFLGALFVVPGPGWALGLYVANAVLSPTISGIGLATGYFNVRF